AALYGEAAGLPRAHELDVDFALAVFFVRARDRGAEREHVAGPHRLLPAHAHAPHVFGAEPARGPRRQRARLEHADAEHRGIAGRARERLVVVHGVHIAGRALVAHEVGARERADGERLRPRALAQLVETRRAHASPSAPSEQTTVRIAFSAKMLMLSPPAASPSR